MVIERDGMIDCVADSLFRPLDCIQENQSIGHDSFLI